MVRSSRSNVGGEMLEISCGEAGKLKGDFVPETMYLQGTSRVFIGGAGSADPLRRLIKCQSCSPVGPSPTLAPS